MLKEFIEHIQKTTQPIIQKIGSATFAITTDGEANEIRPTLDHPDTLPLHSLDALVKLVRTEAAKAQAPLYITIPDHMIVRCFGRPDPDARYFRQVYYEAHATDVPPAGMRRCSWALRRRRSLYGPVSRKRRIPSTP